MTCPADIEGLYLHVPFCAGKCEYCAFYSVPYSQETASEYLAAAGLEFDRALRRYPALASTGTVYFGGGTPTILGLDQLETLVDMFRDRLATHSVIEWTVEANPGTVDARKLGVLRNGGVNRISLGVQFFDDSVLAALGRLHTVADIRAARRQIEKAGFDNWGLDLIACIPGVALSEWERTVRTAAEWEPRHVSVYALTSEEGTKLQARIRDRSVRPLDDEDQLAMLRVAEETLESAGFRRYEISNYAKPGFECRHNLSCWRGCNYIGLGCAAASRVGGRRWTNGADVPAYIDAVRAGDDPPRDEEILTPATDVAERLVFGLRMAEGVDLDAILRDAAWKDAGGIARWKRDLDRLAADGLVARAGNRWMLTSRGRELADHVAVELMP